MTKQLIFCILLFITLAIFAFTAYRYYRLFRLTKPFKVSQWGKRFNLMMKVAFGQTKIFRRPVVGLLHALVFWGFCVILIGSIEMVIDGVSGSERALKVLGIVYDFITASGDIFALLVLVAILAFLFRRLFMHIKRFSGIEMKLKSHADAIIALSLILLLMISLLGLNVSYVALYQAKMMEVAPLIQFFKAFGFDPNAVINMPELYGIFPVSQWIESYIPRGIPVSFWVTLHEIFWWSHIISIFIFANILPYSKHFHVFMSVPNVFLSRLEPLGYLNNMDNVTQEVKMMLDPSFTPENPLPPATRFGVKDVEDITWKNYLDSLSCTECGRCTSVCPANLTGKKLSPRKIIMDVRSRMKEKGPQLIKNKEFSDSKALIGDYISAEELWACTTCNACAQECPVNINHPSLIVDMRRYLVMEEAAGPGELNMTFNFIENNGAPWQLSRDDRMRWAEGLDVPVMASEIAAGKQPEYLLWIGSAGAFDDRYKKVSRAMVQILNKLNISYAVLGLEETDSGDVARRAGNEMLYQMQALSLITTFNQYGVKKILTCCPHDYNTLKNEYPDLGGHYQVLHHTEFLYELLKNGQLQPVKTSAIKATYHDPCYLGRGNGCYEIPRKLLAELNIELIEMKRNRSFALCCGAGGGQMFKEAEQGEKEVFIERTEEALETHTDIIITACPFCMTMLTDGLKYKCMEEKVKNLDIAELVATSIV